MPAFFVTFRKIRSHYPKLGNGDTFSTMFYRIVLCLIISLLIAACGSDNTAEPMFEESADEQPDPGSAPESPAAENEEANDAGDDEYRYDIFPNAVELCVPETTYDFSMVINAATYETSLFWRRG